MERILLLGATSAIAAQIANLHAARGDRMHLVARSPDKLAALAARLGDAMFTQEVCDLTRTELLRVAVARWIETLGGLDRVLLAHGDLGDQLASEQTWEEAEQILEVNLLSAVAALIPLANYLQSRGSGKICVITSVAGERGRPRNYTYGAAKGALSLYLQGLRSRLYGTDVTVTTIVLGPVDTPMTANHPKNALFAQPDAVAREIVRAMDNGRGAVFVPWFWRYIMMIVRNVPEAVFQRFKFLAGR